jgi:hypothetical protein
MKLRKDVFFRDYPDPAEINHERESIGIEII